MVNQIKSVNSMQTNCLRSTDNHFSRQRIQFSEY